MVARRGRVACLHRPRPAAQDAVQRGEYLVHAGGCVSCHTVPGGAPFAGGRALATPFGTFYTPQHHARRRDRHRAVDRCAVPSARCARAGGRMAPAISRYSRTRVSPTSPMRMHWRSRRICSRCRRCGRRTGRTTWRFRSRGGSCKSAGGCCSFARGRSAPDPSHDAVYNRGAYLVTALGHCGECHTPRNVLGAMKPSLALAGTRDGPDGQAVPNITPDRTTRHRRLGQRRHRHAAEDRTHTGAERGEGSDARGCAGRAEDAQRCRPGGDRGVSAGAEAYGLCRRERSEAISMKARNFMEIASLRSQ